MVETFIQSALSKIYWGSPANISISYIESISYSFVYTIHIIYKFIKYLTWQLVTLFSSAAK